MSLLDDVQEGKTDSMKWPSRWLGLNNPIPEISGAILWFLVRIPYTDDSYCRDGWASPSIGLQGACSHHGGVGYIEAASPLRNILAICIGVAVLIAMRITTARWERDRERQRKELKKLPPRSAAPDSRLRCPKCGDVMRKRLAKRGPYKGDRFWGCSRYPNCKGIRKIDEEVQPLTGPGGHSLTQSDERDV
jgi:hypothetical protein